MNVQVNKAGYYEMKVYSCYDLYEIEDENDMISYVTVAIQKLDSKDEKVVYYTPTGEKIIIVKVVPETMEMKLRYMMQRAVD